MDMQAYSEMIHNIVIPGTLSDEEKEKRYQPLRDFLQSETPEKLYRFRKCDEKSISAFDQDQIWVSPGCKMNDDFDALLYFDRELIKSNLKATSENEQLISSLQSFGQGAEFFSEIQNSTLAEILDKRRNDIAQMDPSAMKASLNQIYSFLANQIDIDDAAVRQIVQRTSKFASFTSEIDSAAMWGYYADSSKGFALSYDFRNRNYTKCDSCKTGTQCPDHKACMIAPIIYRDNCFDATVFATWLFQLDIAEKMLMNTNNPALYGLIQTITPPCPDVFMLTKILLHKAAAWKHEFEWRLTCYCRSPKFNQQESSYVEKKPTAVYLGRRISQTDEKKLRQIALGKNIPVYKMQIQQGNPEYKLHPKKIS